jgi:hypothetical protein
MELTSMEAFASAVVSCNEKHISLSADAALVGKLFCVVENSGEFAIAEEVTDGIVPARIRLTPDHRIGQRVRFVYFN